LRREEEKEIDIDVFYMGGEEEEEEEERSLVYCEIMDSRFFIGAFYRRIINY
jgi:hypothetical protein